MTVMDALQPASLEDLREIVARAASTGQPLEICGAGSKRALGRPVAAEARLSLDRLSGIIDYEPAELVLTAQAGTPLAEIEALLAANRQMLAFEPPAWHGLLAGATSHATLGGTLACNMAGPRRIKSGAARDHFLGFAGVNGFGETFKAGGKVVKNVTGYDLCKLMAGSYGTLAVLAEVSVKTVPRPDESRSVLVLGLSDAAAITAMTVALNAPHEVSAAAHLPSAVAVRSRAASVASKQAITALRLEGPRTSIDFRAQALRDLLGARGAIVDLDQTESELFWREIGEVHPILPIEGHVVWRLSVPPSAGAEVLAKATRELDAVGFYDWGGGLLWLAIAGRDDGGAAIVRAALGSSGGHATLVRAPEALRAAVPVFQPLSPALAALTRRVKDSFDPQHLFNRGRLYPDF
jgi:glycolate oxidase FAD binding subunit